MSANTHADASTLVMDSAEGFRSLLAAAGSTAVARWDNDWSNHEFDNQLTAGITFDNRPTWDNPQPTFDNRPTWDNWKNK
ncbi:multiple cyclophane-containing RiPP AmcA [Streptomyces sp. NPDC090021]|uniref:multiple cyclophane-containing RiPP AmcA n=1 Tax=Streptomyces sp. NPDC090021 TaxID=3365919 RepID=UPI003808AAE0